MKHEFTVQKVKTRHGGRGTDWHETHFEIGCSCGYRAQREYAHDIQPLYQEHLNSILIEMLAIDINWVDLDDRVDNE